MDRFAEVCEPVAPHTVVALLAAVVNGQATFVADEGKPAHVRWGPVLGKPHETVLHLPEGAGIVVRIRGARPVVIAAPARPEGQHRPPTAVAVAVHQLIAMVPSDVVEQ